MGKSSFFNEKYLLGSMRTDYYELMYVIPLKYAGEALQPTVDEVEAQLKEAGAEIHSHEQFGKLKFSYKIDHQYQGFYYVANFTGNKGQMQKLHDWLELKKEVLRFIIVKKDPEAKTSMQIRKDELKAQKEEQGEVKVEEKEVSAKKEDKKPKKAEDSKVSKKETKKDEKASLEDLDKKLDNILESEVPTV